MDLEDLEPRNRQPRPKDLDAMGVDELEAYRDQLRAEMERVEAKIAAKKSYLDQAASFFKS